VAKKSTVTPKTHETVVLRHYHSKPYRKRHIGTLLIFTGLFLILAATAIQYRSLISSSIRGSANFVADLFYTSNNYDLKIRSKYGFSLTYDQRKLYASGIDSKDGNLYLGADLNENRAYGTIKLSSTSINPKTAQSALIFNYHQEISYKDQPSIDLAELALNDGSITGSSFQKTSTEDTEIDGKTFSKSVWMLNQSNGVLSGIQAKIITYTAIIEDHPVTIVVNYGLGDSTDDAIYQQVISSIKFNTGDQALAQPTQQILLKISKQKTLLDNILFNNFAGATSAPNSTSDSEKAATLYSPAVVKIYNAYCMDVLVQGVEFLKDACNGTTGSGFIVSQDGYVATNGHVASSDPRDMAISSSIQAYASGQPEYLMALASLTTITKSDLMGLSEVEMFVKIIDAIYEIPDSYITKTNDVSNLLVALDDRSPDIETLLQDTKSRIQYSASSSMKRANVVATDFRLSDVFMSTIGGFKASDVSILKIDGSNYPITKLGAINDVTQGADIFLLGFPGNATGNGIVDSSINTATLTTGKVSSIKNVSGSSKKLIETDATIGYGNSGGPAMQSNGEVVGIATYTSGSSGSGDGVYNYIRDIQDLKDLAKNNSINFDTNSQTQSEWQKGVDNFYTAHYSKAIKNFDKVKSLYAYNSRVDEFIATANKRIANGEDVQDFPVIPVVIASIVVLIGAGVTVFMIIRHKKHNKIYNNQVTQGNIQPIMPGMPSQQVTVPIVQQPAVMPIMTTPNQPIMPITQTQPQPQQQPQAQPTAIQQPQQPNNPQNPFTTQL